MYLIAARKDQQLALVIPEQLSSGVIEIQSAADYPLHLPAGWAVAKLQDGQFASFGSPRLIPRPRRVVVNLVTTSEAGKISWPRFDGPFGSAAADGGPEPKGAEESSPGQDAGLRSTAASQAECLSDTLGGRKASPAERARSPDREPRPPRPRPVSPDPDQAPAPAAEGPQTYQMTEDGTFGPPLPSPNSCLISEELTDLRDLIHEFRDRLNDGSRPLSATNLLKARLDTGNTPPISCPPRRLSPSMRVVVRSAVADVDAKRITEPGVGQLGSPVVVVPKSSGACKLCCDYQELNKHVVIPQQPLPCTDDILASFKGKRYFSVLDMCHGFYQLEIEEEDRSKTSFVTPDCQRQ